LLWLVQHVATGNAAVGASLCRRRGITVGWCCAADDSLAAASCVPRDLTRRCDRRVRAGPGVECATDGESPVNLRWVLMHLLEETARHAGHADILRELIDGQAGR
jgi:hypothetical protein